MAKIARLRATEDPDVFDIINIIVGDPTNFPNDLDLTGRSDASIAETGGTYNSNTDIIAAAGSPLPITDIPSEDFIKRFTDDEWADIAFAAFAGVYPNDSSVPNNVRRTLFKFREKITTRDTVPVDNSTVQNIVNNMETVGLIGAGRAAEILATM